MPIDLGDVPQGTIPNLAQVIQLRKALSAVAEDDARLKPIIAAVDVTGILVNEEFPPRALTNGEDIPVVHLLLRRFEYQDTGRPNYDCNFEIDASNSYHWQLEFLTAGDHQNCWELNMSGLIAGEAYSAYFYSSGGKLNPIEETIWTIDSTNSTENITGSPVLTKGLATMEQIIDNALQGTAVTASYNNGSNPLDDTQKAQARLNIGLGTGFSLGTVSSNPTPVLLNGTFQYGVVTANIEVQAPIAATDGSSITLSLKASGTDRNLSFATGVLKPSDSTSTWPKVMTNGKTYICKLLYTQGSWCLISLIGGYVV